DGADRVGHTQRAGDADLEDALHASAGARGVGLGCAQVDVRHGLPGAVGDRDRDVRTMSERTMTFTRRQTLLSALFGAGYVGLRALATGLPASFLLNPRRALAAAPACTADKGKAQF